MCRIKKLIVMAVTVILVLACSKDIDQTQTITSNDFKLNKITSNEIPNYSRIIAAATGSYEILESMGFKNSVVGIGITEKKESNSDVIEVTEGHNFNLELVLSLNPDLILTDELTQFNETQLKTISKTQIVVHKIDTAISIPDVEKKIDVIAGLLNTPTAAKLLKSNLPPISDYESLDLKVVFLYLRGNNSIYLIGGPGSGTDSLIVAAGGQDAGAEYLTNSFTPLSAEALASLDPEVFLVMRKGLDSVGGLNGFLDLPGVSQTTAGQKRSVISVEDELLLSYGVKTFDLIRELNLRFRGFSESK